MQRISSAITVCIPTFGRLDVVCDTVNQLVNAIRPGDEIIVVDQNTPSLRQQSEYFQRLCTHSSVRVIESTPANLPAARNTAARFANNDILVFVDDDVIMPWNFLDEHRLACTDQSITAVGGCWVQVGDEEEKVSAGDATWLPYGLPHSLTNDGDEDCIILVAAAMPH